MKNCTRPFKHFISVTLMAFVFPLTLCQTSVQAAPGTLSNIPLYIGTSVEPNIVILNDDSGSMDWEILTSNNAQMGTFNGGNQPDGSGPDTVTHRTACSFDTSSETGGYQFIVQHNNNFLDGSIADDCSVAADDSWRARNSDFNKLYFDPSKTYEPWKGVNQSGIAYANVSINKAPYDPYTADPANPAHHIDLEISDSLGNTSPSTGFKFYTWDDVDSDGIYDAGETISEYNIRTMSLTEAAQWNDSNGDPKTKAVIQQDFANWFSYHRKRAYVAKYAISTATDDITGIRLGYATLNNTGSVNTVVSSMNLDPSIGVKRTLFNNLFKTTYSASAYQTPLKEALDETGKYFDCSTGSDGIFNSDCPILSDADGGSCQRNVTIMLTDGYYDTASTGYTDKDSDGYSDTLADIAKHFYDTDLSTLANEVPSYGSDTATHQHMNTYTVAFGVTGTLDSSLDPSTVTWPDPSTSNSTKVDDLWHTAVNGLGSFYSAQNPDDLVSAISAAVTSSTKGTTTAAAVAFNTTTLDADSVVYQAKFNPSEDWKGELTSTELAADGTIASSPTWNAGDELTPSSHASRVIYTFKKDTVTPANSTGILFDTLTDLSATQQADLNMGPSGIADGNGQDRLDYIRGDNSNESGGEFYRDRTNILGDIVHSNPVFVGAPQSGYPDNNDFGGGDFTTYYSTFSKDTSVKNRAGIVYVGANDGMLHGFKASDGSEALAYIPNAVFSDATDEGLHYLTESDYSHRYYVDLSPTVADAYVGSSWKTILVGGLRAGGRGIFALDVTNPANFTNNAAKAADIVGWEFDSDDDAELGYTFSKPTIALMENNKWAAIFGNGYNSTGTGRAYLYILYLDGGLDGVWTENTDYFKIDTGSAAANGLSTPAVADTDGNGKADRAYAGDLLGNMWAFDLSGTHATTPGWSLDYKLFTATNNATTAQAITSKPVIANQDSSVTAAGPNLMVYFGTGQYLVDGDKTTTTSTHQQSFYGVWDSGSGSIDRSKMTEQVLTTSGTTRTTGNTSIAYKTTNNGNKGWYHDLDTNGERVIVNPKIRGPYVFYNTLIPGTESCSPQGSGWLMAVKQIDGTMADEDKEIFDTNGDGEIDADDERVAGIKLDNIPAGSNFLGEVMYTPDDEGNVDVRTIDAGISLESGRMSWQQISE